MAVFNANTRFTEQKKLSVPVVRVPQKVKEAFHIEKAYESGIFKIEPGDGVCLYDQCYIFEDVNYINQNEEKKESMLLLFMHWLKSMNTQFKITLASERRDMVRYIEEILAQVKKDEFPEVHAGVRQWIVQKTCEGTKDVTKLLYLTITCRAKSLEDAKSYFASMETALELTFSALKSSLYRMNAAERFQTLQKMLRGENRIVPEAVQCRRGAFKNQIYPLSIEQQRDYMRLDDQYVSVLVGQDYEQSLNEEKVLQDLLEVPFPIYITLDIAPISKNILKKRLTNAHTNNEKAISQERSRNFSIGQYGAGTSYRLEKKKMDIENDLTRMDDNDESGLYIGLLVMVVASTLEELASRVDTLKNIAYGYRLDPYYWRQLKALNTCMPIGGRQVNHMRSLMTSGGVAFQPFYAKNLKEPDGFVYGLNRVTKQLIRANRKNLKAPHAIVVGHTGGGKSFFIKETEVAQSLISTNDDIIMIDPNNESMGMIRKWGGQYFDFTPKSQVHLNPFEVPKRLWEEGDRIEQEKFVALKTSFAVAFCEAVMEGIAVTQKHRTLIGRAVRAMYTDFFSGKKVKKQPTLCDLQKILQSACGEDREEKKTCRDIMDSLEEYTIGAYDMFAHASNLNINNRLVGFGLNNVPKEIWEVVMLTMMHFVTVRIEYNQEQLTAARLIVDETQVLCKKGSSAAQLLYAVETYRKKGGIVTLAIQNLTRALELSDLRDMFSNCTMKVFFDQGGIDALSLRDIQELSDSEFQALSENTPGNGIFVWDGQVYRLDCMMDKDNPLYHDFNTDFHEKAERKRDA